MSAQQIDSNTQKTLAFVLFIALFYLYFFLTLELKPFSDDVTFLSVATSGESPLHYLARRYNVWTGRIVIEAVMYTTIAYSAFWKLAIPTLLLLSIYATWRVFFSKTIDFRYGIPICMALMLLTGHNILDTTIYYVTGFYNYLLPISAAVFVCATFMRPSLFSTPEKFLAIPLALIASQSEQAGISTLALFTLSLLWDKKSSLAYRSTLLVIVAIGFAFLITAPGNYLRLVSELRYMPEFNDYNIIKKISTGFDVFNAHYTDTRNLYPKAIGILITMLAFQKQFKFKKIAFVLMAIGVFQGSIFSNIFNIGTNEYYSLRYASTGLGLEYFLSYTLSILSLVSMIYIMKQLLENDASFYLATFFLLLHTAVTTLVGLSPTAYESGYRVLLAGDMISLMLICLLIKELIDQRSHCVLPTPSK